MNFLVQSDALKAMYIHFHDCVSNISTCKHLNTNLKTFRESNQYKIMIHIHKLIFHKLFWENVQYETISEMLMF